MTHDEAMKLARELANECQLDTEQCDAIEPTFRSDIRHLCNYILSGGMKREIENAAYERGYRQAVQDATDAQPCTAENPREDTYQHGRFDGVMDYGRAIRALIQPPAQKENGE